MLNIVVLNGGRGAAALIPALLRQRGINVTSVVNAYDDGKSTGDIRRFFGMLGPSDIRKVQELMLPEAEPDYRANLALFQLRCPATATREEVLGAMTQFGAGESQDLFGIVVENGKVRQALRRFVREFVEGLAAIERVTGEQLEFGDCSVMNCIYAGAFLAFDRNLESAIRYIDRLFKLKGTVLPTSIENKRLVAQRENGDVLYSEAEIVELRSNVLIERIYLLDRVPDRDRFERLSVEDRRRYLAQHHCFVATSPGVLLAVQQADIIIYSAGTQHSSLYPTYLSSGLAAAIADNRSAHKVFVTNIGADYETPTYKASDYLLGAFRYLCLSGDRQYQMEEFFDSVLINRSAFKRDSTYVEFDEATFDALPTECLVDVFESASDPGKHDGEKVVRTILSLYEASTTLD